MYKCDCSDEDLEKAYLPLTKKTYFCILDNYITYCTSRNLPNYSKRVNNLRFFHNCNFKISIVDNHNNTSFEQSNDTKICLLSQNCITKLAKCLDEACTVEFLKFMIKHNVQYQDKLTQGGVESNTLISYLAPKNF